MARCKGRKADGTACGAIASLVKADGWCPAHGPGASERMRERAVKGGQATAAKHRRNVEPPALPETADDAVYWSAWAMHSVATGAIDTSTAREISSNCRVFLTALDKAHLEGEVKRLKAAVKELQDRG